MTKSALPSVFDQIADSLRSGIAHARGEVVLKTTTLPAPPPAAPPKRITALRKHLKMSQSEFAATLNVSPRTVRVWERGLQRPSHASLRMLQLLQEEPRVVEFILAAGRGGRSAES